MDSGQSASTHSPISVHSFCIYSLRGLWNLKFTLKTGQSKPIDRFIWIVIVHLRFPGLRLVSTWHKPNTLSDIYLSFHSFEPSHFNTVIRLSSMIETENVHAIHCLKHCKTTIMLNIQWKITEECILIINIVTKNTISKCGSKCFIFMVIKGIP